MRTLFLDCTTGVSGDMLLASLTHAVDELEGPGQGFSVLQSELEKLDLKGFELDVRERKIAGIMTRFLDVRQTSDQPLRHLADLTRIIEGADLSEFVASHSLEAVKALANAESKVHGTTVDHVHFHEVGAVDTIVDIVGAVALVAHLQAGKIVASAVDLGSGFVEMAHGRLPVPPPACAELAKGMVTFASNSGIERATPTGLALIRTLAQGFTTLPLGELQAVGYGCGSRSGDDQPTYVRAFVINEVCEESVLAEHVHA
ncbi:LarC family nickel insertion protein [Salidesulfovibrio onnuriiensis]|uniref:LarC family nickel insertion protein n=1 Tax=Salidesulfovibrio onnuriiensis TaxID=2583823 RepID=UPI0011C7443F|nr:LarC family nickel insertion protein [Salidesulfovibrio onnuriiensis]